MLPRRGDSKEDRFQGQRVLGFEASAHSVRLPIGGERQIEDRRPTAPVGASISDPQPGESTLAVAVLESGAVRLTIGPSIATDRGLLVDANPPAATLNVTVTPEGLQITSERQGGYGPDPEDISIEIVDSPLGLAVADAGGRQLFRLAGDFETWPAPLGHATLTGQDGDSTAWTSIAFPIEPEEHLYGLVDTLTGRDRLDLVGTAQMVEPGPSQSRPPLLLSSRGYGLMVHSAAPVQADLGASTPGLGVLSVAESTLDLFIFPSTWPRAALSGYARLTGQAPLPDLKAFGLLVTSPEAPLPVTPERPNAPKRPASGSDAPTNAPADLLTSLAARLDAASIPHEVPGADPTRPSLLERELAAITNSPADPGFTGVSRPVGPPTDPEAMRARLRDAARFGLSTPGFWRTDLAPNDDQGISPSLLARWAQVALLSPLAGIEADPRATLDDLPAWADPSVLPVVQAYAQLRYRLLPYLLHCAREAAESGLPMLRPLLLEFSWDAETLDIDDQLLLGRDLMLAPICSDDPGQVTRRVYLPGYANWYDWWTGTLYEGRQWIETTASLERLPLYARAGTAIPLADPRSAVGESPVDVTRLLLLAPRDGAIGASVELAGDDMLGVEQERGERKARFYIEGIPRKVRDLEIVGLPSSAFLVDASALSIALTPSDGALPGIGGTWNSLTVKLDVGAFTAGLELGW